eukprot:scaffold7527_cov104-Skeletonema_dohrnii-CCMP3373.AAC.1
MAMLVSCLSPLRLGVHAQKIQPADRAAAALYHAYICTSLQPDRSEPVEAEAEAGVLELA